MIACTHKGCRASVSWMAPPSEPDKALIGMAVADGWERSADGWLCPQHRPASDRKEQQ